MKKLLIILSAALLMTACAENEADNVGEQSFEFMDKEIFVSQADETWYDDNGSPIMIRFNDFGRMGLADLAQGSASYQWVALGQEVEGMTVAVADTSTTFELTDGGEWLLTDTNVLLKGGITLDGYLFKTVDGEFEMLPPDALTFMAVQSESGIVPLPYFGGYSATPPPSLRLIISDSSDYNPENEHPDMFSVANPIYVTAELDNINLRYTERASGGNYAELLAIQGEWT